MNNINPLFDTIKDKIDVNSDIYAFVDESGDPSVKIYDNQEWFGVSAILMSKSCSSVMLSIIQKFNYKFRSKKENFLNSTFKDLKPNHIYSLLDKLNTPKCKYLTIHSVFYKPYLQNDNFFSKYPNMYFAGIVNVFERISWVPLQSNQPIRKIHIIISRCSKLEDKIYIKFIFDSKNKRIICSNLGNISIENQMQYPKLLLADYTASSMRYTLEQNCHKKIHHNICFNTFLKGRLFNSMYKLYAGVWRNGIKCRPDCLDLVDSRILAGGSKTPHSFF